MFTVNGVTSGTDSVKRVLSGDDALVMLDVMMPDTNGDDVLRSSAVGDRAMTGFGPR